MRNREEKKEWIEYLSKPNNFSFYFINKKPTYFHTTETSDEPESVDAR